MNHEQRSAKFRDYIEKLSDNVDKNANYYKDYINHPPRNPNLRNPGNNANFFQMQMQNNRGEESKEGGEAQNNMGEMENSISNSGPQGAQGGQGNLVLGMGRGESASSKRNFHYSNNIIYYNIL